VALAAVLVIAGIWYAPWRQRAAAERQLVAAQRQAEEERQAREK
jgi:hypothetical protein